MQNASLSADATPGPPSGATGYVTCPHLSYHTQTQEGACGGAGWTGSGAGGRYPSELCGPT